MAKNTENKIVTENGFEIDPKKVAELVQNFETANDTVDKATYVLEITETNRILKLKKNTIETLAKTYGIEKEKLKNYYSEKKNKAVFRSVLAFLEYRPDIFAVTE